MQIHPTGFERLIVGEPTKDALFREEYFEAKAAEKRDEKHGEEVVEPSMRQRATLIRAQVVAGVGRFFAG